MLPVLSRDQIRAYDRHAIERCAVPGVILMENAGRGAAELLLARHAPLDGPVVIVCGRGNNGGDGFVVARQLMAAGVSVEVFVMPPRASIAGDARVNFDALLGVGGRVRDIEDGLDDLQVSLAHARLVVDALLGTGLSRPVTGLWGEVIELLNHVEVPLLSLDIPSGIDANSGQVHGVAVQAAHTITFGAYKCGLLQGPAVRHAGELSLVGLGVPEELILAEVGSLGWVIDGAELRRAMVARPADTHKYLAGSVLLIAGSEGKVGAALLCAEAALRAGAGIATIASWPGATAALQGQALEVMTHTLDPQALEASLQQGLHKRAAVAIGPGLGLDERARRLTELVVLGYAGPAVVDADAISHFAGRPEALQGAAGPRVLTPHSGELARLLGCSSADIEADRFAAVRRAADLTGAVVLLKGHRTLVAEPAGPPHVCICGSPLLGTAGSGDALTGIIAALLCSNPAAVAARVGCQWHALTAASWRARVGADRGMLARDIIAELPHALAAATKSVRPA